MPNKPQITLQNAPVSREMWQTFDSFIFIYKHEWVVCVAYFKLVISNEMEKVRRKKIK